MIMVMQIDTERAGNLRTEQPRILGVLRHRFRLARTANMPIEANDAVTLRHHDMQVVRDEQNAEVALVTYASNQIVQVSLSDKIDATRRLIEHEQIGITQKRPRNQNALCFAARELRQLLIAGAFGADVFKRTTDRVIRYRKPKRQKTRDGHRNSALDIEPLRHISDPRRHWQCHVPAIRLLNSENKFDECRFAGAVRAYQRNNLIPPDIEINSGQDRAAMPGKFKPARRHERGRVDRRTVIMPAPATIAMRVVMRVPVVSVRGLKAMGCLSGQANRLRRI